MYITETTENVRELIEKLDKTDDTNKLKFLIYIFGLLNNNQINDKNEVNPNLIEDENIKIFNLESIGLQLNTCTVLLQHFAMIYNCITNTRDAYEINGNILGIKYDKLDEQLNSQFEQLGFNEKLDVFSEIIIKYDNATYFNTRITMLQFDSKLSGYEIANEIMRLKI